MATDKSILQSLDAFIRKYYKNLLIKGVLYSVALLVTLFLIVVVLEHFGYFSSLVRGILFWAYLISALFVLGRFVASPLLKMFKLGSHLSYEAAARIIGRHFPEVDDKLLNLLQLHQLADSQESDLLQASIEQKTRQLRPIPFLQAIDLRANRKYLKYALPPLAVVLLILVAAPSFMSQPARRLINYNTYYEKPAPFRFVVENESLDISQQEDFQLNVAIEGEAVPSEAFINIEGSIYRMQQVDKSHYTYLFKNVHQSRRFSLQAAGVSSEEYLLNVFPRPSVVNFRVTLSYPSYTGRQVETLENEGDFTIPEGTVVKWQFQTQDAEAFYFDTTQLTVNDNGRVSKSLRVMASMDYGFFVTNHHIAKIDTLRYSVSVVPDAVPMIAVMELTDSTMPDRIFFHGRIKDDYGFSRLEFKVVRYNQADPTAKDTSVTRIAISKETSQEFDFMVNANELNLMPGDHLQYYFEVWDNDGVHGSKSSKSQQFDLEIPSEKELEHILDRNASNAMNQAETSMSDLKKLQQDINDLMKKLVDNKELSWQDKKDLQELSKKQREVKDMLQKMQEQLKENNRLEQKYREQNEQIIEKQKELDRLFNEVMTDEMKEMMKEIDKLLQETDKKKVQEQLEHLKHNNEDLEKQLDQNLELMKRLEMEKKVESAIQKAEKLAEKQRELSQQTEQAKPKDKESLQQKQQQLNEDFDALKKEIEKIQKDYKSIDKDIDFKVNKEREQHIDQLQDEASKQLDKGHNKEASKQQKEAADEMDKLSEELAQEQMDMEQDDLAEDSEMIRRLLKNLITLSFNQESLITKANNTYIQDPNYQSIIKEQNKIKADFRNVEDSLSAVAKRQVKVASAITKEVSNVNNNVATSLKSLLDFNQSFYGNSKNGNATRSMQYAMTSFNNLSLILAESLDKMQQQMRQNQQQKKNGSCKKKSGKTKSNCSNPGSGKPSAKSMKQMQDELNKQMESLKKQLDKQGNKPNGRRQIGQQGSMSEQFAKMAAQQEMIRRMMQEYGQELKQQDASNGKLAREIDEMMRQMEQTETDLVNKTITQQTIRRQQQIMTRMLQHEKAEMEREKEERRESHEAKDMYQPSPADLEKFRKLNQKNVDMFPSTPPSLTPYYKSKVDDYFYKF